MARSFQPPPSCRALGWVFDGLAINGVGATFVTVQRRPLAKESPDSADGGSGFGRQLGVVGGCADYLP